MTQLSTRLAAPFRTIFQRRSSALIRTRHVDLRARGLNLGVRIVLASDIHARDDWFPRTHVVDMVRAINAVEGADLVALVGDFVGDDETAIDWSSEEFAHIEAPIAAVLGNHDHWTDPVRVTDALEAIGATVLTNRALPLADVARDGAGGDVWLAGIDSCWVLRSPLPGADITAAFADVPIDAETIVLGHEPHLATMHEHVLHLAGHTHCGQVRTPLLGDWTARLHMPRYSEPYPSRLYEEGVEHGAHAGAMAPNQRTSRDRRWIYTTAGVGYSTVDFRVMCPPEIVVIDA